MNKDSKPVLGRKANWQGGMVEKRRQLKALKIPEMGTTFCTLHSRGSCIPSLRNLSNKSLIGTPLSHLPVPLEELRIRLCQCH